jgi:hypothetical protein
MRVRNAAFLRPTLEWLEHVAQPDRMPTMIETGQNLRGEQKEAEDADRTRACGSDRPQEVSEILAPFNLC